MKQTIKYWALTAFLFVAKSFGLFAAADPASALNSGTKTLIKNANEFLTIPMILCIISGGISVAWALIDRKNAQEGANQRLMNVGIGLLVAFLIILILKAVLSGLGSNVTFSSQPN